MSGSFLAASSFISGSSKSISESSRGATAKGDGIVYLDNNSIDDMLRGWKKMDFSVEIEFLGRGISRALNEKHWAWLLIGNSFYCTIEYGADGIVIQYFTKERGIKTACAAIMGDSGTVNYDDQFRTSMNFAEILTAVNKMKNSWTAKYYDATEKNCRDFVRNLGRQMDSSFNPPNAVLDSLVRLTALIPLDATFPKKRSVN
jgi:hypothetical protein